MDIWMAAVAAGAGYIANHFKKSKIQNSRKDDSEVTTSEFDGEKGVNPGNYEGSSVFSASNLFPGFVGNDGVLKDYESMGDWLHKPLNHKNKMILRNRRKMGRVIRPLTSLESCVMAQLYTEHVEMKEHVYTSVRPFLVTDGSKVINKANGGAFTMQNNTVEKKLQTYSEEDNVDTRITNTTSNMEHFDSSRGSSDATLLLCLGMSFGILSSFMAHKREIEKLNRMLKQKENLVQDLEEELEMKDSLIMKELTIDDHKPGRMDGGGFSNDVSPPVSRDGHNWGQLTNGNNKELVNSQKEKDGSFSEIEAELEAELEMLELNMTSSTLQRKISNLIELDPDLEPDVAQGELRADMVLDKEANTNRNDSCTTTTTPCANYAVSPRELSLRLHELLESQLEERIRELEAEIESKNHKSWRDFSSSDEHERVDEAVVLNLSGEALDAYNEACNEFMKFDDESDEEDVISGVKDFDEDEMEKMLINRIVEKARQGSPVVLNAQRALFSE